MNYYNENDRSAANWLVELTLAGLIPYGWVDTRSITEVKPNELEGFTQCHFFAGIGGWSYALRLAGWPDNRPVWTGSCPCQPFSIAGKGRGSADERHLWPAWFKLISECKPPDIFGEQVASPSALGWLDGVFTDLESKNYACGAADLCAAGVGAPHIRQRLFWLAESQQQRLERLTRHGDNRGEPGRLDTGSTRSAGKSGSNSGLGDADSARSQQGNRPPTPDRYGSPPITDGSAWDNYAFIPCADGKARCIESGTEPLAHGVSGRVGLLRGYGNAIVPQVAAEVIKTYMEVDNEL